MNQSSRVLTADSQKGPSLTTHKIAAWEDLYYKAKTLVRPITKHRRALERVKYLGVPILSPGEGNDVIARSFGGAVAVGKIGSSELAVLRYFLRHADSSGYCEFPEWQVMNLYRIAGVYPPEPAIVVDFCRTFAKALTCIDILAVWFNWGEKKVRNRFAPTTALTSFDALEPYYHERPWSAHLEGKRVLVVSPFVDTIKRQYERRREIWPSKPQVLPEFSLLTLRSPLSAFLNPPKHPNWFAALDAMQEQMTSMKFDVAIVGAGAWSLPLVAHAKFLGAWTIHLGGATQILFGIKGGRWDKHQKISPFYNDAWTRPALNETPSQVQKIEGGCYW